MNTLKNVKSVCLALLLVTTGFSVPAESREPGRFTVYAGTGMQGLDGDPVISLDGEIVYDISRWLRAGLWGTAIHTMEKTYSDPYGRAYQAESGAAGLVLSPYWKMGSHLEAGISMRTGMQLIQFRYAKEYRAAMDWTEEYGDKLDIPLLETGLFATLRFRSLHSLRFEGGYRFVGEEPSSWMDEGKTGGSFFGRLQYGVRL